MSRSPYLLPAFLLAAATSPAQTTAPGFVSTTLVSPGSIYDRCWTLADGSFLVLSQEDLTLRAPDGSLIRMLHDFRAQYGTGGWAGFLLVDPSQTFVVYSLSPFDWEVEPNGVFRVDLAGGTPVEIYGYGSVAGDAFETPSTILGAWVAAETDDCGVTRFDMASSQISEVVEDQGWAGPLLVDGAGDLLLVMAPVNAPANGWEVLRFTASQIAGAPALPFSAGTLEHAGLFDVRGLDRDPLGSALFLAANRWSRPSVRALDDSRLPATLVELPFPAEYFFNWDALQFLPGDGRAAFLPYQPSSGGTLIYASRDDAGNYVRRALQPARPQAAVLGQGVGGPGPFDVWVRGGPPLGQGIVAFGPSSLFQPEELVFPLRVPLFLGLDLATLAAAPGRIQLDATGRGSIGYLNPGIVGELAIQVLLLDAEGRIAGTSTAAFL